MLDVMLLYDFYLKEQHPKGITILDHNENLYKFLETMYFNAIKVCSTIIVAISA